MTEAGRDGSGEFDGLADQGQVDIVVAVGTDHHPFDRLVGWVDRWAAEHPTRRVLIQRGTSTRPQHCLSVELVPHGELCERFARATVVVSHGGPSTVMDARMAGRLPVVVARDPEHGEHVDQHQLRFARHIRRHGLARLAETEDELRRLLDESLTRPELFSVPRDRSTAGGVSEFGRAVDALLGVTTPLVPASPASVDADLPARPKAPVHPETETETGSGTGVEAIR